MQLEGGVGGRQSALDEERGFMFLDVLGTVHIPKFMKYAGVMIVGVKKSFVGESLSRM